MTTAFQSGAFQENSFQIDATGGGVAYSLTGDSGSYSITGNVGTFSVARALSGASGTYSLTGNIGTFTYTPGSGPIAYTLAGDAGHYTLSGGDATFGWSGVVVHGGGGHVNRQAEHSKWVDRLVREDEELLAMLSVSLFELCD